MWFLMRKTEFTSRNYMYKHIRIIVYIKEKNIKLTENIVNVSCITCKAMSLNVSMPLKALMK